MTYWSFFLVDFDHRKSYLAIAFSDLRFAIWNFHCYCHLWLGVNTNCMFDFSFVNKEYTEQQVWRSLEFDEPLKLWNSVLVQNTRLGILRLQFTRLWPPRKWGVGAQVFFVWTIFCKKYLCQVHSKIQAYMLCICVMFAVNDQSLAISSLPPPWCDTSTLWMNLLGSICVFPVVTLEGPPINGKSPRQRRAKQCTNKGCFKIS